MKEEDLKQLATREDLENLRNKLLKSIEDLMNGKRSQREFYSPKEFVFLTGEKYSTVIRKCNDGRLNARHDFPKAAWQIQASELKRYESESN